MMVGRLLSFWDGLFSGAMLNFQGVATFAPCKLRSVNCLSKLPGSPSTRLGPVVPSWQSYVEAVYTPHSESKQSCWPMHLFCISPIDECEKNTKAPHRSFPCHPCNSWQSKLKSWVLNSKAPALFLRQAEAKIVGVSTAHRQGGPK